MLYELFTGKRPYDAKTLQQLIDLQESAHLASMTSIATDVDPAVEKVIRRCLDPDPVKRPASALAVAAALPGGDPLAAALAAGETPSPELVAAAGKVEGLARKYSIPCLLVIAASLRWWRRGFTRATAPTCGRRSKARRTCWRIRRARSPLPSAIRIGRPIPRC